MLKRIPEQSVNKSYSHRVFFRLLFLINHITITLSVSLSLPLSEPPQRGRHKHSETALIHTTMCVSQHQFLRLLHTLLFIVCAFWSAAGAL